MNRAERKARQERRRRMLAREQGRPWPDPAAPQQKAAGPIPQAPSRAGDSAGGAGGLLHPGLPRRADAPAGNARPLSPVLRRRRRRRRLALAAVVLAVALAVAMATGALSAAAGAMGDALDSVALYFERGEGWPADTGLTSLVRAEPLAGGFVALDSEDVVVYSAYGERVRAFQPGYARPALAVGSTRFAVYSRAGGEVRVESRTRELGVKAYEQGILLCAMSNNGSLAVVTQSERYAAVLEILDPSLHSVVTYSLTQESGVPVALAFAADNHRLANGAVAAAQGQMCSMVYFMDTRRDDMGPCYTADAGSLILELRWLGGSRVMAVFDTYLAILDASTGQEQARYSYNGAGLQGVATAGRQTALLLSIRGGNTLVTLSEALTPMAMIPAAQAATVAATETDVYLLNGNDILCYSYDGVQRFAKTLEARPQAVLSAGRTLLLAGGVAQPLADIT